MIRSLRFLQILSILSGLFAGTLSSAITLTEVVQSVLRFHPEKEVAQAEVERFENRLLGASGFFDPQLSMELKENQSDLYPFSNFSSQIKQATPFWGTEFTLGYRTGVGTYPSYYGKQATLSDGEFAFGVTVPILKNGWIDRGRARIAIEDLGVIREQELFRGIAVELSDRASRAYFDWAVSYLRLEIRRSILRVAEERQARIESRIKAGDLPRMVGVDNQRLILDRKASLVKAEQDFKESNLKLSYYFRDRNGNPRILNPTETPRIDSLRRIDWNRCFSEPAKLDQLPIVKALSAELEAQNKNVELQRNQLMPSLNFKAERAMDYGDGSTSIAPNEFRASLELELPLFFREGRGKLAEARVKRMQQEQKIRLARDKASLEIRRAKVEVTQSGKQREIFREELDLAKTLEEAERKSFGAGESNLINVNLREEATARVNSQLVKTEFDLLKALSRYYASRGQQTHSEIAGCLTKTNPQTVESN